MNVDKTTEIYEAQWLSERAEYFNGIYCDIKELRDSGDLADKQITIVGCWNNAKEIIDICARLGLVVSMIADNNPNKQGLSRYGIIAQSVESLLGQENLSILVLNNLYWRDIQQQLLRLGFSQNREFYVLYGGEKFRPRQELAENSSVISTELWSQYCHRAQNGYNSHLKLKEKYGDLPIWLMHQPSIGDLYIFSLFLPAAMGVKSVMDCDCVLVVVKNSTKRLAEALGFRHIEIIPFEEANHDWLMLLKLMGDQLPVRNAVYHGLNEIFQSLIWNTAVSFRDSFTKYVFHFEHEVEPIFPELPKRETQVHQIFSDLGLRPGKTVLISPYAGHFDAAITGEQWARLVDGLITKGYSVCTNCASKEEPPLPNTVAAFIELQDSVQFTETAGCFIGIRSGFCDILCTAECPKIVIYETGAPAASIDYFGFKNMGITDSFLELVNDCIHTDDLIDEILQLV